MDTMKPILGFPGYYVTNDGQVWSTRDRRRSTEPRRLAVQRAKSGYITVLL